MINNPNQNRKMWKYLLLFPALGLFFIGLSSSTLKEQVVEEVSVIEPILQEETTNSTAISKTQNDTKNAHNPNESETQKDEEETFMLVEKMPKFPGGDEAMRKFLHENLKYPEKAEKHKIQGRVFINFVVAKDGSVSNATVVRGVDADLDREALRVVKSMPKWTPGTQKGKNVRVSYTVPVNFVLK